MGELTPRGHGTSWHKAIPEAPHDHHQSFVKDDNMEPLTVPPMPSYKNKYIKIKTHTHMCMSFHLFLERLRISVFVCSEVAEAPKQQSQFLCQSIHFTKYHAQLYYMSNNGTQRVSMALYPNISLYTEPIWEQWLLFHIISKVRLHLLETFSNFTPEIIYLGWRKSLKSYFTITT